MPESKEQAADMVPHRTPSGDSTSGRRTNILSPHLHLVSSPPGDLSPGPLLNSRIRKNDLPSWLRPFFSLHIQLTLVYSLILMFVVLIIYILLYQQAYPAYLGLAALASIIGGSTAAFLFTSLLLRPLWRVTDAAQAIALGDLKQCERLPLRLPPQDEIDRLAGCLHEMVEQLEYAREMQHAAEQRFQRFFL